MRVGKIKIQKMKTVIITHEVKIIQSGEKRMMQMQQIA